jgi:hypothetical protein
MRLFRPIPRINARAQLGFDDIDRIVLFSAGKTPRSKGIDLVKESVKLAEKKVGKIRLVVLRHNISPDDMPLFYNAADCLLFASRWEGSPNVVKEAMACNLPVVSTRVGDVEKRLEGVRDSYITERDAAQMGDALAEVIMAGKRSNGRERIEELSLERTTKRIIGIYESVLYGKPRLA